AVICDRLSRDPGRYRRGLPDLLVFDTASPVGFELLEVKGPGDQLRPEQKAWLDYLNDEGIPAKVLAVSWSEG
ncbi:MAG: VRR-NUC domain-containing protein, partial [Holophagales bacterium]|nr:VRR-NUC domain-containing protein [Holophagales bacterium]